MEGAGEGEMGQSQVRARGVEVAQQGHAGSGREGSYSPAGSMGLSSPGASGPSHSPGGGGAVLEVDGGRLPVNG